MKLGFALTLWIVLVSMFILMSSENTLIKVPIGIMMVYFILESMVEVE